ncbi:MAG: ABC transporter permease [Planctomycetaceae bacterium]
MSRSTAHQGRNRWVSAVGEYIGMLLVLGTLAAVFGSLSDRFLTLPTLTTLVNQIPALTMVAVGMTFVLITGGIDLSVGSVTALCASVVGVLMVDRGWSVWSAVPVGILAGAICGLINGSVSVLAGIPSFIVTLGVLEIARGAARLITDSQTKFIGAAIAPIGARIDGLGVSPAFIAAAIGVLCAQVVLRRTLFGRYCTAIGFNETVVKYSGIDPRWTRIAAFIVCGSLAGAAGVIEASRLEVADSNAAIGFELSAIAAAVIGGTSLMGGRGSMINTFFGVLIIAVLQTGLAHLGVREGTKGMITGSVIVAAVLLDATRGRLRTFAARSRRE